MGTAIKLPDFTSLDSSRVLSAGAPTPVPTTEVASTPNIGAEGQSLEGFGEVTRQAGSNLQDLVNTADVNNAIANDFQPKLRELANNFYSLQGKAAMDAAKGTEDTPSYGQQVTAAMNETAQTLTGQAQKMFIQQTQPKVDGELYRASQHGGQQTMVYNNQSYEARKSNDLDELQTNLTTGDMNSASDRINILKAHEYGQMKLLGIDPGSDIGKARIAVLDNNVQNTVMGAIASKPADQQMAIANKLLQNGNAAAPAASGANSSSFNLGNVKTTQGAINNTQDFVKPATPADGVALTANNLRSSYQGLTLQQIGQKWTGESADKVSAWVNNVATTSGLSASAVPNLDDPQQLSSLLSGIAVAEKSPADRANFTPAVIAQGVQQSLSGAQVNIAGSTGETSPQPVANPSYMGIGLNEPVVMKIVEAAKKNQEVTQNVQKKEYQQQMDQFAADPHFVSMSQVPPNITAGYAIEPKAQQYLEARAEYNLKNTSNIVDADKLKFGSGFYNLLQNVYSPNGINNVSDLYQYTGQQGVLTIPGFDALKQELSQKQDPAGQAVAEAKQRLFDMGAKAIYGQAQSYGLSDPKGEELHQKWLALALTDYNNGVKADKSPSALLSPESPDYIGKSISMFQRDPSEIMHQQLNPEAQGTLGTGSLSAVSDAIKYGRISSAQANIVVPQILKTEYAAGRMTKDQVHNSMIQFGLLRSSPAPTPARAPRPGIEENE